MFQVDFASREPIYEQLVQSVIKLASAGAIKAGDKLPPVRVLAQQLGINPNTAAKAYHILENDGYIFTTVGRGSFLTDLLEKSAHTVMAVSDFKEAVKNAMLYSVEKQELIDIINDMYGGGNKDA